MAFSLPLPTIRNESWHADTGTVKKNLMADRKIGAYYLR